MGEKAVGVSKPFGLWCQSDVHPRLWGERDKGTGLAREGPHHELERRKPWSAQQGASGHRLVVGGIRHWAEIARSWSYHHAQSLVKSFQRRWTPGTAAGCVNSLYSSQGKRSLFWKGGPHIHLHAATEGQRMGGKQGDITPTKGRACEGRAASSDKNVSKVLLEALCTNIHSLDSVVGKYKP